MVDVPGYRIEELLSWGSQGDVFRAVDASGVRVAMKIVTAERGDGDPQAMVRLAREARLLAAIDSPHVVKVREFLQTPEWSCLVLEFLDGQRLDSLLRERAGLGRESSPEAVATADTVKLPPGDDREVVASPLVPVAPALQTAEHVTFALDIAIQLATGVAELHAIRLIHRDLKPQNAMVVDGRVVLIDFGFARRQGITTMTQTGTAIGTLAYMAPEQLRGGAASERGDVYALGATIHQCLTGAPPFGAEANSIAAMAARGRPKNVRRRNPAVSPALAAVVARCLEPDPRDRYAEAAEVLADLQRVRTGEAVRVPITAGKLWRHHGRWLRRLTVVAVAGLLAAFFWPGFDPKAEAAALLADLADGSAESTAKRAMARSRWLVLSEGERERVAVCVNQRLGADERLAAAAAQALDLALLRLLPRLHHRVALLPSRPGEPPPPVAMADFVEVDEPRCLLVRPGTAWCLVMSAERQAWWANDDPRCMQCLLELKAGELGAPPRSLDVLPTKPLGGPDVPLAAFAAGEHLVRNSAGAATAIDIASCFSVATIESPLAWLHDFRRRMGGQREQREQVDLWTRHPDEPDEVAAALWRVWLANTAHGTERLPAQLTFWEAHRMATWFGFRLPARREWETFGGDAVRMLGKPDERVVPASLATVDETPAWDCTVRRIRGANSNAREWSLAPNNELPAIACFHALPGVVKMSKVKTFSVLPGWGEGAAASELHGVRLVRTRLRDL